MTRLLFTPLSFSIQSLSVVYHCLHLRIHSSVILLRNLNPTGGLRNGTRLTIRALLDHIIDAEIATGVHKGRRVLSIALPWLPFILTFLLYFGGGSFPLVLHSVRRSTKSKDRVWRMWVCFSHPLRQSLATANLMFFKQVQNPNGLNVMVCGGNTSSIGGL